MMDRFKYALLIAISLVFTTLVLSLPAQAQDTNSRLSRIENEIQTLSRAVFRGEMPPAGVVSAGDNTSAAGTELRLQEIEMELRSLTGKIEQQHFQTRQLQDTVEKTIADMEMRIAELEMRLSDGRRSSYPSPGSADVPSGLQAKTVEGAGATSPAVPGFETRIIGLGEPRKSSSDTAPTTGRLGTLSYPVETAEANESSTELPSAVLAGDPTDSYERAFSLLRDRNYSASGDAFQAFLDRYPGHDLAPNAKYWLGETFYVRNDFERAARVFAEAYQQYPDGPKGPDNLLKLGMALAGLGKKEDACLAYAQLQKEYPKGAVPILARADKEMDALDCR